MKTAAQNPRTPGNQNPDVARVFQGYRRDVRARLLHLRALILEVASASDQIGDVEETLKWGEPSYLVKGGSTVRIAGKKASPDHYAVYFNCNTKLVDTFRELYNDTFCFEGNRAIVFDVNDAVPEEALKHCISLALHYQKLKDLPLLGA